MSIHRNLTVARLRFVLKYDPPSGQFVWLKSTGSRAVIGRVAGSVGKNGHRYISVDGEKYLASRLAWLWMNGEWPAAEIDHEDLDASNDRWSNLRPASRSQNEANKPLLRNNTSGSKGIYINRTSKSNPYVAFIKHNGVRSHVGCFPTLEAAAAARDAVAAKLFGRFYRAECSRNDSSDCPGRGDQS